jgi:hypothetical protein
MIRMRGGAALLLVCTALAACGPSAEEVCATAQAKFSLCGIGGLEQGCGDYSPCQLDCFNGSGCDQAKEILLGPETELSASLRKCLTACH